MNGFLKESMDLYEKKTGKSPWIMYAHVAGPTKEFFDWLDEHMLVPPMKDIHMCPTCGAECVIGGDSKSDGGTRYYIPLKNQSSGATNLPQISTDVILDKNPE